MNYTLTIPIDAPTMSRAQAIAWKVLGMLPAGTAFAIRAQPEPKGEKPPPPSGRTWTPAELRDIEDGIVPAARRYDAEFVAAVKAKAEGKAQ